jgi:hypothetical protein
MFIQVCFLSKRYVAALYVTRIGSLFCVSPQVIKKVVPPAENLATSAEFAAKEPYKPMSFRV